LIALQVWLKARSAGGRPEGKEIMKEQIDRSVWINYFNEFTRRNQSRLTKLEVFGKFGAQEEGHGLPLASISLERGNGAPSVEIMFSRPNGSAPFHLRHVIDNVQQITPKCSWDGCDEALEIVDRQGEKNLLTFQPADDSSQQQEWSWCKSPFEFLSSINLPLHPARQS
jgi:Family of unknown function (DUF5335)